MRIGWLHETEPRGVEGALGSPGSAGEEEEEAAVPVVEGVEVQGVAEVQEEEDEDLRAASSAVEEAAEEDGADTCAPSPGEGCSFSWSQMDQCRHSEHPVTVKTRTCSVLLFYVFVMSCILRIKFTVTSFNPNFLSFLT